MQGRAATVDHRVRAAFEPVDASSLVAFRVIFGLLVAAASARFVARGWVHEHFLEPDRFFPFWGLPWVRPLPGAWMYALYAVLFVAALAVAAGALYRVAAATVLVTFSYAHFCDKTYYLNHYYLVTLLAAIMLALPLHRAGSVDAWLRARRGDRSWGCNAFPAWFLWLVRLQIGVVYFFAGVAKLQSDWLFEAQPLGIWLPRSADLPFVGALFHHRETAFVMSWAGAAFDLSAPFFLSSKKARPFAYAAVIVFHALTAQLFRLGMFPYMMTLFATIFFSPSWPRDLLARLRRRGRGSGAPLHVFSAVTSRSRWVLGAAAAYAFVQLLLPLRHHLYPGNVLWTEEGFRFAWKVMLIEKNGSVDLDVRDKRTGERFFVSAADYLTAEQARMMSTQPDMILQFCHMVRDDFRARGRDVEVYVRADVALNGRPSAPFIDPSVDMAQERDGLAPKRWVLPMPTSRPRPVARAP
jgi:hypothetical protein